jgi:hypothetical protein
MNNIYNNLLEKVSIYQMIQECYLISKNLSIVFENVSKINKH